MMNKLTEYIVCAIENTYIVEMAYDRKKFKDLIDSLSNQIIENWFLIRYAHISNTRSELMIHWRKELIGHIDNICKTTFKMNRRNQICSYREKTKYIILSLCKNYCTFAR